MSDAYYTGNGIYEYLAKGTNRDDFFWTSGHLWLLVYGDECFVPKVLTVASGSRLGVNTTDEERMAVHVAGQIIQGTNIPVNFIRFDSDKPVETIQYWESKMKCLSEISSEELKNRFARYGLKMNDIMTHKSINDRSSSPFHDWQRKNMGDSVVVADIDLVRYRNNVPVEIIELKRSYIELERWEPYPVDYKNFILLSKLSHARGLQFYIVYNKRIKTPFYDDVSRLKIFEFDDRRQPYCQLAGYRTIGQFAESTAGEQR